MVFLSFFSQIFLKKWEILKNWPKKGIFVGPGGVYAKMFFEVPKEGVIKLAQGGGHNRGKFKVGVSPLAHVCRPPYFVPSSILSAYLFLCGGFSWKSCLQIGQEDTLPAQSPHTALSQLWKGKCIVVHYLTHMVCMSHSLAWQQNKDWGFSKQTGQSTLSSGGKETVSFKNIQS